MPLAPLSLVTDSCLVSAWSILGSLWTSSAELSQLACTEERCSRSSDYHRKSKPLSMLELHHGAMIEAAARWLRESAAALLLAVDQRVHPER